MKKVLSCCLGLIVLVVGALFIAYQTMPSEYQIMRTQTVAGTPAEVFEVASDLHTWPDWTFWSREADPTAVWDWTGPETGAGSAMSWKGDVHGQGKLEIIEVEPDKSISYRLTFDEDGEAMSSNGKMEFSASGTGTQVVWTMNGELDGIWKLMAPLMDGMVGEMFTVGLTGLDAHIKEKQAE